MISAAPTRKLAMLAAAKAGSLEEVQPDERPLGAALVEDESGERHSADDQPGPVDRACLRRRSLASTVWVPVPRPMVTPARASGHETGADVVHLPALPPARLGPRRRPLGGDLGIGVGISLVRTRGMRPPVVPQQPPADGHEDQAERDVDHEDEAPATRAASEPDAVEGAQDSPGFGRSADDAQHQRPPAQREHVGGGGHGDGHQRPASGRLDDPGHHEEVEPVEEDAERAPHHEERQRDHGHGPAAPDVGQTAEERHGDRVAQQVAGDDPAGVVDVLARRCRASA